MNSTDMTRLLCAAGRATAILVVAALSTNRATNVQAELLYSVTSVTPDNGQINTIDADTGALLHSFAAPVAPQSGGGSGLAYSGETLYYTTITGPAIYALDPVSGAVETQFNGPGGIDALGYGQSEHGETLFALAYNARRMFLLDPTDGEVFASYVLPFNSIGGVDFNHERGTLYVTESFGEIYELDPDTGGVINQFSTGAFQLGLGIVGGRLFTVARAASPRVPVQIVERDPLTGDVLRSFPSPGGLPGGLAGGPAVPEPATISLAAAACCVGMAALLRRRRRDREHSAP